MVCASFAYSEGEGDERGLNQNLRYLAEILFARGSTTCECGCGKWAHFPYRPYPCVKHQEGVKACRFFMVAYPPQWPIAAWFVKENAGWRCERCGVPHGDVPNVLTVHHLDGNKWNLEWWNLVALCQRCHLRIQAKVDFYQDSFSGVHSEWMARHVEAYNQWAKRNGRHLLRLTRGVRRSYENEWS